MMGIQHRGCRSFFHEPELKMKKKNRFIIAALLSLSVLAGIGIGTIQEPTPAQMSDERQSRVDDRLVTANTQFSFKLFSEILKQQPSENIFISPASVAIALAVSYNGASGQTQQDIAQTLELQGISLQEINQAQATLKATLENPDPSVQLAIANSLWVKEGESFKPEFLQNVHDFYGAQVQTLNFSAPTALSTINDWIRKSTNNKIKEIASPQDISSSTVFVLLDAIYFLGTWTYPFPQEATVERPFTLPDGKKKQIPMMFQYLSGINYYQNDQFQAIQLPYGNERLSMYIFLPNPEISLDTFYKYLNAKNWQQWLNQVSYYEDPILIGLPRFQLEYDIDLKDTLKALGMEIAFDQGADFSAMTSKRIHISQIKHKTFVEVNEQGTEATGSTMPSGTRGGDFMNSRQMIVDRPFFCVIQDKQTQTILFMGSIVAP